MIMKKAPNFSLQNQFDETVSLSDYAGKWLIVYFYPKDDTPGCTAEACSVRDEYDYLMDKGLNVVGISKDTVASHKRFAEKYKLNFPILADPEHKVIEAYGAWGPKKFLGKEYIGTSRASFLIDPEGNIAKEYPKVTPKTHISEILKDFSSLKP
jgi:thioredoxin-dependent peroxiredoxin